MTIKRLILSLLTLVAIFFAGVSLFESWNQPQIQSRLELYQTNLLLQAQQWQPEDSQEAPLAKARNTIVGEKPEEAATKQYQEIRRLATNNLEKAKNQLAQLLEQPTTTPSTPKPTSEIVPVTDTSRLRQQQQLQQSIKALERLNAELNLQLGLLQAEQKQVDPALKTWGRLREQGVGSSGKSDRRFPPIGTFQEREQKVEGHRGKVVGAGYTAQPPKKQTIELNPPPNQLVETAAVLTGLWSNPSRIEPDAQQLIQENLDGWFRYRALSRLYELQQRQEAQRALKEAEQKAAQLALMKLALIGSIPALGGLIGVVLLIFLLIQRLLTGKESLLAQNEDVSWSTPWSGETVWQVFVLGFFLMGQLVVPLVIALLPFKLAGSPVRIQAFYVLVNYMLLASGGLGVLYISIKPFLPLPKDWFRFNLRGKWFLWGIGGYCVALPLIVLVSLINQQLWQGQGGSNPLLSLALEAQDRVALAIFFYTAAIAAPFFEEFLFRGFLLPSLTRYLPVWGAILFSSLLFALAHLSLSEILPLTVLGTILGVVYTRSRNLLAPMLLHSLWNSGTLISLFILGSR